MSESSAEKMYEATEQFTRMWGDFASRMMAAGLTFPSNGSPTDAAHQMRNAMFESMSRFAEDFMRSPQFLESVRQGMETAIAFRKQLNEFLTRMHHETQGAARSDIDSIMVGMRHLETRVLERLEDLSARVDAISRRLEGLDGERTSEVTSETPPESPSPPSEGKVGHRPRNRRV